MADITKCSGDDCPIKEKCYRYTAIADPVWQSNFSITPFNFKNDWCEYYCTY